MTKEELINKICPIDAIGDCYLEVNNTNCNKCRELLESWIDEYSNTLISKYKKEREIYGATH